MAWKSSEASRLIILFLIAVLLLFLAYLYPSFRFLRVFRSGLQTPPPAPEEIQIAEAHLKIELYRPKKSPSTTMIIVSGLHPYGIFDPRYRAFAQSFAQAGFQVIAPDIEDFRNFKITLQSVDQIERLVQSLPNHFTPETLRNIGILGISYGAGPAFIAAARPSVNKRIGFLISVGGYYNLIHAMEFVVTGIHEKNGERHYRMPQQWGRMIFAFHNLRDLAPEADQTLLTQILLLKLHLKEAEAKEAEKKLSGLDRELMNEIEHGFSPKNMDRFKEIMNRNRELCMELSPSSFLDPLSPMTRFYLIHGRNDDLVPYEETLEMADALKKAGKKRLHALTTASLSHVDIQQSKDFWGYLKLLFWMRDLLREAKRK